MDNDNNVGGIFTKLNWKIIQFIDVNHAYKQFKNRFLKFNFDNKNIFSDIIKSFLKFVKVLMLDRDLPLITKKEQFFNITEHFSNNHQKCLHENLIDFKIPAFAKNINLKNRLDTFLDDNVIIFEKTEPHKNTQCNESLHSLKIKLAPKNKSWKMTFSTRMKITVLLWNEGHKFYYQLMNNFNIAELNDHNKQIIDKYILRKTLNKEKQQTEKYIQQKNKTRNLRRQSGRKEGDYKLKKVFTPINIEFRETDVLHSDFKEEEETNDLDFRETNFNSPEEDSFFKDINADDWFSMTIFDLFNFGKLFLDQALLGNIFRLYNIANNCYINSGIQLLMSSEHFRTKLLLFNKEDDLLLFLKKCTKDIVNKRDIDYIINYYINNSTQTIKYNEKGDTSAFLLFLLNDLEEKYNMIANMTGFIAKSILCSQCGARNEVLENNLLYSISCSELQNIEDCCKNEPINDSICQFCRNTPLMMTQIVSINILLIIHLTDSNYEQIFHIKETLHINQKLYSMKSIVYFRDLPDSGHYFDVVRQNNKWFLISDSFINQIKSPFEIDKKSRPEILLYEQIMQDL
ncbi:hypothetical protein TRFO_37885 [Tritrichomonas foetus]|nr:hypothetical protein TRFO_37885 [Tritrichomonas foetus]|eukprot:OHS95967.1 hypothetical protein TRFO_37885 [Tritrichomonas foetus]